MRNSLHIVLVGTIVQLFVNGVLSAQELRPRILPPKAATIVKPPFESKLHVKFSDDLKVRADRGNVRSALARDLGGVRTVQARFNLTFQPVMLLPQETIDFVEQRSAETSGTAQPDFAGMMVVTGPDELLQEAAQALLDLDETEWVQFVSAENEPQCQDLSPVTPSYFPPPFPSQSYHALDPGLNISCAWTYGGKGLQVKVGVVDWVFTVDHEDLCNVWTATPPQCQQFPAFVGHGTAVLGQLVALDNGYGCTGLVPQAAPRFYAGFYTGECPNYGGTAGAILAATADLAAGDVIVIELGSIVPVLGGAGPAELAQAIFAAVSSATASNIIVVEVAGNGGADLDHDNPGLNAWRSWGDSGAIIVGAGHPSAGTPPGDPVTRHNRCAPCLEGQPNAYDSTFGSRVNVQGWGEQVFTLGYGTHCDPSCSHAPGVRGYYTEKFAGTSSAAPMVAAAAASLQSIRVAKGLVRLTPSQMRQVLIETGIPQGTDTVAQHVGPFPNVTNALLHPLMEVGQDCNNNSVPDRCEGGAACCLPADSCVVWTQSCCAQAGGTFLSQQTDCETQRACCRPPPYEDCIVTTLPCCDAVGGTFKELKLTCGPAVCPAYDAPSPEP